MKRTLFAISVTLLTLYVSQEPRAADFCSDNKFIKTDGACWNSLVPIAKLNVVKGIWVGGQTRSKTLKLAGMDTFIWMSVDLNEVPPSTTLGDVMAYFDELYSSPANRDILWSSAYVLAAMKARDDDENDRLNLLRFLRENEWLPTGGILLGADGADQVRVSVDGKALTIKLAGVDVSGEPPTTKALIPKFIDGLKKYGYGGCHEPSDTSVEITYHDDIFDSQNRLVAYVSVPNYGFICSSKQIPVGELSGHNGTRWMLNGYLIRKGLAKPLPASDPKWTKAKRDAREWLTATLGENASEKAGFYRFGGKKDPLVETIALGR